MASQKIRVGLIGLGGWAKYGHIPALQSLAQEFEIVAVSSRHQVLADEYAAQFNIRHAFNDEQALITHPDVDLVVILAPAFEGFSKFVLRKRLTWDELRLTLQ